MNVVAGRRQLDFERGSHLAASFVFFALAAFGGGVVS